MDDLVFIKKHYGEKMMHLCRKLFPTILEDKNKLKEIMDNTFMHSRELYGDLIRYNLVKDFKEFILTKYLNHDRELSETDLSPFELMKEAGYTLYECRCEEDLQKFKKYYTDDELLCTFRTNRLASCYVFFAVKDNVDDIKRSVIPSRQDEYGTSVISIQFTKDRYTLSIKNRYNHTVYNPDATFSNNLENIIPGLTNSFEKYLDHYIDYVEDVYFEIPKYKIFKGMYYKYNYEINNIYYCIDNIIIDNDKLINLEKEECILADYYIIDLKDKEIYLYDDLIYDSFEYIYINIENISVRKCNDNRIISVTTKDKKESKIVIDKKNQIIEYFNNSLEILEFKFMSRCDCIRSLHLPNVKIISDYCFSNSLFIKELSFPLLTEMGSYCFCKCNMLENIDMPNLKKMGNWCFPFCNNLSRLDLPKLEVMANDCFERCNYLSIINLPKVKSIGTTCFSDTKILRELYLPELIEMGCFSFKDCNSITKIDLPKLKILDKYCFDSVDNIKEINMQSVEILTGGNFNYGKSIDEIYLPNLKSIGIDCFFHFYKIGKVDLPKLIDISEYNFYCSSIDSLNIPLLENNINIKFNKLLKKQNYVSIPKRLVDRFKKLLRKEQKDKCKILKR